MYSRAVIYDRRAFKGLTTGRIGLQCTYRDPEFLKSEVVLKLELDPAPALRLLLLLDLQQTIGISLTVDREKAYMACMGFEPRTTEGKSQEIISHKNCLPNHGDL